MDDNQSMESFIDVHKLMVKGIEKSNITSSIVIANTLLSLAKQEERYLTHQTLQPILYFLALDVRQSLNYSIFIEPFLVTEAGPVLITIYDHFKGFQREPITKLGCDVHGVSESWVFNSTDFLELEFSFQKTWDRYKNCSEQVLQRLTTQKDSHNYQAQAVGMPYFFV